jgi:hypothetical protein
MDDFIKRNICRKTLSGAHIWEEQHRYSAQGESLPMITRCIACGMIDDMEEEKKDE